MKTYVEIYIKMYCYTHFYIASDTYFEYYSLELFKYNL
jgi:hypothetical protein